MVNRGEIWWAESPNEKRRPFLILTRQAAIPVLHSLLSVPATRQIRTIPTELTLDEEDGMPSSCALSFDNMATIPKTYFTERICQLGPMRMSEVCRVLSVASGCR